MERVGMGRRVEYYHGNLENRRVDSWSMRAAAAVLLHSARIFPPLSMNNLFFADGNQNEHRDCWSEKRRQKNIALLLSLLHPLTLSLPPPLCIINLSLGISVHSRGRNNTVHELHAEKT